MELYPPPSVRSRGIRQRPASYVWVTLKKRENKRVKSLFILEETSWAKPCTPETEVKGMSPGNGEREGWELET